MSTPEPAITSCTVFSWTGSSIVPWTLVSFILVAAAAFPVSEVTVLPGASRMRVRFEFLSMTMLEASDFALEGSGVLHGLVVVEP